MSRPGDVDAVVVGAGLMGRWHAHAIERAGSRLVAVVDPDTGRARRLAERHGAATVPDFDRLPDQAGPVVVHVCTPSRTHSPLIQAALDRGWSALVEKPMTVGADDARRLLGLADDRGLLLAPVHQFGFQRGVRKLLGKPARLGQILHLRGTARSAGAEGLGEAEADRVALEILPHFLSLAHRFLPDGLDGIRWSATRTRPGELSVSGTGDATALEFVVSMGGRPPATEWVVIGTEASGRADLFHGYATIERGDTSRRWKVMRPFAVSGAEMMGAAANLAGRAARQQPAYPGLRELIRAFHQAVLRGGPNPISAHEAIAVAEAVDRIRDLTASRDAR